MSETIKSTVKKTIKSSHYLTLIALAASLQAGLNPAQATDWPQYRGPSLDGSTPETIQTKWPAGGPKEIWKTAVTGGFSSFTVVGGEAFTIVRRSIDGADQEVCIALDASTGKEIWAGPLTTIAKYDGGGDSGTKENKGGDGPRSTPTVDSGKVYALSGQCSLHCFDAKTGKTIWGKDILTEFHGKNIQWQNSASPVIDGNLLFVGGGGPGESLICLSKINGLTVWKGQTETITHSTPVVANILGVRQVIFFTRSGLVALAPKTGAVLWKQPFKFAVSTAITPIVSGDIVYCAAGYGVGSAAYKIAKQGEAFSSTEMWRSTGNQPVANHWSTPVCKDGYLYGMFQFKEYGTGPLKCVELATGKVKWEQAGYGPGNVILAGGNLLALSDAGELITVEATPDAYKEISRAKVLSGKCWSTPVVSGGRVFARSTTQAVCVDVSTKAAAK
jgi:outer membrane protein assembly factor BamB